MSKIFIDLYYFFKSLFFKIETVKDDISYVHLIPPCTEPQLKVQVPAGSKGHKEASNHILLGCKNFYGYCNYIFRSKA